MFKPDKASLMTERCRRWNLELFSKRVKV